MKILLINNHTQHLTELSAALEGNDVEIRSYQPGVDFSCEDKDLIILSGGGGEGLEINDEHKPGRLWYYDQMEFIRSCQKPIVGICMGFEVISRAFGAQVKEMGYLIERFADLNTTGQGQTLFGKPELRQFEAHSWHVPEAPQGFDVLAASATGVEIIKHQSRPILATQFHPEKGGTVSLEQLIAYLVPRQAKQTVFA